MAMMLPVTGAEAGIVAGRNPLRALKCADKMESSPLSAQLKIDDRLVTYSRDPSWQRAWLNIEAADWRSIAFIPAGDFSSLDLVHGLAAVGWQQRGTPLVVADLRSIGLAALAAARTEIRRRVDNGDRLLISVAALDRNPLSATLAREADKAILCVSLGHSARAQLKEAVRELGVQRCLGAIMIRANGHASIGPKK